LYRAVGKSGLKATRLRAFFHPGGKRPILQFRWCVWIQLAIACDFILGGEWIELRDVPRSLLDDHFRHQPVKRLMIAPTSAVVA